MAGATGGSLASASGRDADADPGSARTFDRGYRLPGYRRAAAHGRDREIRYAASDLVCILVQPSPLDVWAAREIFDLVEECRVLKPSLIVRFVINRAVPRTVLAAEVEAALEKFRTPQLPVVRNRAEYAKAIRAGQTAMETRPGGPGDPGTGR